MALMLISEVADVNASTTRLKVILHAFWISHLSLTGRAPPTLLLVFMERSRAEERVMGN